jgi:hypothetical protein
MKKAGRNILRHPIIQEMCVLRRYAIFTVIASLLAGAEGACSSSTDNQPPDRDAGIEDVSGEIGPIDAAWSDGVDDAPTEDAIARDTMAGDMARMDVVRPDGAVRDADRDDAPADRVRSDTPASTDGSSIDASTVDGEPRDSTPSDSTPGDSTPTDGVAPDGNDPACPISFNAAMGIDCAPQGRVCVYPEGTCGCIASCGPPPPPDAGGRWMCKIRGAGCPIQKPTSGSACSMDAQLCDYGTCCTDLMRCENGQWRSGGVLCPP